MKYKYIIAIVLGAAIADLTTLGLRHWMLPAEGPKLRSTSRSSTPRYQTSRRSDYNSVVTRNLFNSAEEIIDAPGGTGRNQLADLKPVPSGLPLQLIGTIVHANPQRSVASVELKSQNKIISTATHQTIENIARVEKITRRQLIFTNLNNKRLEFIEMKIDAQVSYGRSKKTNRSSEQVSDGIVRSGNKFTIERSALEKHLKNLPRLLQEARAVPNKDPQTGELNGFRILDLLPGSLFETIGVQRLDVVKGVNGENIDSPAKAMELFNQLKSADNIKVTINREGRDQELEYTIKE